MTVKSRKRPQRAARPDASDELAQLRERLAEAHAALRAIRRGEVDAVVVESKVGPRVYTLDGAEFDYRVLIESMNEGALVLTRSTVILYANTHFARMVERPLAQLMGSSLNNLLSTAHQVALRRLVSRTGTVGATAEVDLRLPRGVPVPARVSIRRLPGTAGKNLSFGMVVSDMSAFHEREDLLRRFSRRLMHVQETERVQIATDLGDNIAQLLCAILVRCQLLVGRLPIHESAFRKETVGFAKLLRATADKVHRISSKLRPHGLEILGLVAALRGLAAESADRMGVSIEMNCARMTTRLPAGAELALYRILQEALRNVEQHAQARHVTVTLRRRGPVVQLYVKDDGIGFDANDRRAEGVRARAFGLLGMRERAAAVGGALEVKSGTSTGTEVRLSVPLSPRSKTGL